MTERHVEMAKLLKRAVDDGDAGLSTASASEISDVYWHDMRTAMFQVTVGPEGYLIAIFPLVKL